MTDRSLMIGFLAFTMMGVSSLLVAAPLVSGQPLTPTAPGIQNAGNLAANRFPAGAANVFGNGPYDVFLSLQEVMPFIEFNEEGSPVYGDPVPIANGASNGRIILNTGGDIWAVFWSGKTLTTRRLDIPTMAFVGSSSRILTLPANITSAAAIRRPNGSLAVAVSTPNGESNLPPTPPDANAANFRPYDGQGRWRGDLPSFQLHTAVFPSLTLGPPSFTGSAFGGGKVFFSSQPGLTFLSPPTPETAISFLVGSDKGGAIRLFTLDQTGAVAGGRGLVTASDGFGLIHRSVSANPVSAMSEDGNWGHLFMGDTGRLWLYRFDGLADSGMPRFTDPLPIRRQDYPHTLADLPVISTGDIDGDGLIDILGGNDGGHIFWMRNIGTATEPEFDIPRFLDIDGGDLIIRPGPTRSLQGPGESAWGYTCPTLYDWNGDGHLDIIFSSSRAEVHVIFQIPGTPGEPPIFGPPMAIYSDGVPMSITWRQQLAATDWGIEGNDQLVTFDERDQLRVFYRLDNLNVRRGETLHLQTGATVLANTQFSGQYGRTKLQVVDWDGDGRMDLLAGVRRWHSIPDPINGLPQSVGGARQSGALFLRNVGTNQAPRFAFPQSFRFQGDLIRLGAHSTSVSAVDLGTGQLDLLISEEMGTIMYYSREDLTP